MTHPPYHDDPAVQAAIVACIDDMLAVPNPDTQVRQFVVRRQPIRITTSNGVLAMVEKWQPVGGGLRHDVVADYSCFVCREPIADDPHTFHAEGCPKRDERPCENNMCIGLTGCGDDCHDGCCPTCTGQALDPDPEDS